MHTPAPGIWPFTLCASRLGVPAGRPATTPFTALFSTASSTSPGAATLFATRCRAARPAACAEAADVPLMLLTATSLLLHAEVRFTPGALMSTQGPQFVNAARLLLLSVAATVIAAGVDPGE